MSRRRVAFLLGTGAALLWLSIGVALLDRYGPTWDCAVGEYPLGESLLHAFTSDASLREAPLHATFGELRAPHPAFALENSWWACWPVASTLSAASCKLFWSALGWLPAMSAHDLPVVVFVALLVFAMVRWMVPRAGIGAALLAPLLLLTSPRFFADAFNNLKDVPEAVLYAVALLVSAKAIRDGGRRWWLLAGALTGAALAQKTNAIFLPIELLAWVVLARLLRIRLREDQPRPAAWAGVALALVTSIVVYFALSPQYWFDPVERLKLHYTHVFRTGNVAFRAAEFGNDSILARLKIDPDGVLQVLWTTPLPLLALFVVGLFAPALAGRDRLLLLIGTLVPIARTLAPGMVNFDGVRHFDEFVPPMCMVAAAGLSWLASHVARSLQPRAGRVVAGAAAVAVALAAVAPGARATVATHPNGCAWFNALVGGLRGAQARQVRDATDYWANSYWQVVDWLNEHAEPGAAVVAPVAGPVLRAIAPVKLRADLHVSSLEDSDRDAPLYVVYVTRRGHYDRFVTRLDGAHAPLHQVEVDGAPIVRVHRLAPGDEAGAALAELRDVQLDVLVRQSIARAWATAPPEQASQIRAVIRDHRALGHDETLRRLRALLPPELGGMAEAFLRALEADERAGRTVRGG